MTDDQNQSRRGRSFIARFLLWLVAIIVALAAALYVAHLASPWPSALFYRFLFDRGGEKMNAALAKHVPPGVGEIRDRRYDIADPDAVLDVYFPADAAKTGRALTTIVWIHGGGFIAGSKDHVANYARILAAKGYTVVAVNYTLAPEARYARPLGQINAALASILRNAEMFHADPNRIVLAGDSAGAQLAAQMAAMIAAPGYAKSVGVLPAIGRDRLIGAVLFCGLYDKRLIKLEGPFAGFLRTVGRAYFGSSDFANSPQVAQFSVIDHVTPDFPPTFISAGNNDPLLAHSPAMADALAAKGVAVDRLFFPADYKPPLGHEYQFDLDTDAGRLALDRLLKFLVGL